MCCFLSSVANALFLDLIAGAVHGKAYRNYMVTCGQIEGNLFTGFLIQDVGITAIKESNPVTKLGSLYLRINPYDLFQRRLKIEQAKLNDLKVYVKNFDDFLQNLISLFGQSSLSHNTNALKWFETVECSRMVFYNLQLENPLELLFTNRQFLDEYDLKINDKIRFEGSLEWDAKEVRLRASAKDFHSLSSDSNLPISLELLFDLQNNGGELAILSEGTPVKNLVTMKGLSYDGSVTLESRLKFSQHRDLIGSGAKQAQLKDGESIYYALNGEGRLFSNFVKFEGFELKDLYLRAKWTEEKFELEHSQSMFLGSHVDWSYGYDPKNKHRYSINFKNLEVHRLFKVLKFDQLSDDLRGEVSFGIRGNQQRLNFSPMVVHSLKYLSTPLYLKDIRIEPISSDVFADDLELTFESRGGSYMGAFVDKVRGFLNREKLTFSMTCDGVSIRDIEPLKRRSKTLGVRGRANVMFGGEIRFAEKDYVLSATGDFFEVEVAGLPIESLHFSYNKKSDRNLWTWHMNLPLSDGQFDFEMDFLKKKGGIILEVNEFDLAYFKQRIPDFPLSGEVKGKLKVDFEPELTVKLIVNSGDLKLYNVPLQDSFLEIYLKKDKFQWKLKDRTLYTYAHGKHRLFDFVNSKMNLNVIDVLGDFRFEVKERRLQRFSSLPYFNKLRFTQGTIDLSGNYNKSSESIKFRPKNLTLTGDQTHLDFRSDAPIMWTKSKNLSGSLKVWFKDNLNDFEQELAYLEFDGNNARLKLNQFRSSLLKEMSLSDYLLPFHGTVDMDLKVTNFDQNPNYKMVFNGSPIYVDVKGKDTYLEKISGELFLDSEGLEARKITLIKQGGTFSIDGKLPLRLRPKEWRIETIKGGEIDMKVQIPETPINVIRDLFPEYEGEVDGSFALDVKLSGSVEKPSMNGTGSMQIASLKIPAFSRSMELQSGKLKLDFVDNHLKVKQLQGRLDEMIFHLSGEVYPFERFKFFLKGDVAQPRFNHWFMDLQGARLSKVLINGSSGQLQASAFISANKAVIFYEDLMRWIERDSSPLKIPFFSHYDFDLKIQQAENVGLRAEFFKMDVEPNMQIKIRPKNTYLNGYIGVREGSLELARNHFKIEAGSMIRFIPREQKIRLSPSPFELDSGTPVWSSGDFQLQSVTDKLQTMWERDYTNESAMTGKLAWYEGDKTFDTRLNLRAFTEVGKRRIFLALNGPLETMDYSLNSDDENLGKGDVLKLLASRGVGSRNMAVAVSRDADGTNSYRVGNQDDEQLLSGQISATLEDQVLGRPFESLLGSLFNFQEVSLEPNFLGNQNGLGRFRMGTRLSKDITLTHEQENREFGSKKQTRLELKLDEELGLIFKREQTVDRPFDLFQGDVEKDFQFGFERRLKF